MTIDILAALTSANPKRGSRRCKLAVILDDIDDDTPGKDALVAAVDDATGYPAARLTMTFSAIGHPIHKDSIADHRAKRCRCYR